MICLILLLIMNCQSTNYYEVAGVKNELFTKREGTHNSNTSGFGINDRIDNYNKKAQVKGWAEVTVNNSADMLVDSNKKEVRELEDMQNIVTALGSAIAGIYCLVKTIINAIKKVKRN